MLYTQTVSPKTLELLIRLMNDTTFNRFLLVGGTALSLQLGHRLSLDLDLFCNESFDESALAEYLRTAYHFHLDFIEKETKQPTTMVSLVALLHKQKTKKGCPSRSILFFAT